MPRTARDRRNLELALIHIGKAQLGLDDATYRSMLRTLTRQESAAKLDYAGRRRVIDHLRACGANIIGSGLPVVAHDREALLRKLAALLKDQGLPWAYLTRSATPGEPSMVQRMCKVDRLEFCTPEMLRKLVAALTYRERRQRDAQAKEAER